jgi:hydrogenase maturation factor HypF (carbamoyltransferase family)
MSKFLRCKICKGEIELNDNERTVARKVKCRKCGFSNETKGPEVVILRKRPVAID